VILPRLGALIASESVASINEVISMVHAPVREIYFNSSIVHNDGLLAHSVARRDRITYEEACRVIDQEIESLKAILLQEGEVRIGRLGLLKTAEEGRLVFKPLYTSEKRVSKLGLKPVSLPLLAEVKAQVAESDQADGFEIEAKRRNLYMVPKRMMKVAAAVVIMVCAALSFLIPSVDTGIKKDYASLMPAIAQADAIENNTADLVEVNDSVYSLVVASVHSKKTAELFVSQHKNSNWTLEVIEGAKYVHVIAKRSSDVAELLELARMKEFSKEYPGSWVLERE
jgi:hypothetical protein